MRRCVVLGIIVLLACGDGYREGDLIAGVEGNLTLRHAAWTARGIEDYDLDLRHGNEWVPTETWRIEVRNGVAVSARNLETGEPSPLTGHPFTVTIDTLFAIAKGFSAGPGLVLEVRFHSTMDYIVYFRKDEVSWADDSFWYGVVRFQPR